MPTPTLIVAPLRLLPVIVTGIVTPRNELGGLIPVSAGANGITLKIRSLLMPAAVVTVKFLPPSEAPAAAVNVAVIS